MDVNFKLTTPDGQVIDSDSIAWVTSTTTSSGIIDAHDGPGVGRRIALDMKTIPMDVLLELSKNNFQGMERIPVPKPYKYLSDSIVDLIEVTRERIVFVTESGQFELLINANPIWVRPRSPFS